MSDVSTTTPKTMTFIAACKDYFGFKEGQNLSSFMEEIKQLTTEDRAALKAAGIPDTNEGNE